MLDPNKLKRKIPVDDFITFIRKYSTKNIEDSGHAFKRLSQRQRELFTIEGIRSILLKEKPFLAGIQENGNHAVFYKHEGKNLRIILKIDSQKIKIVTFYNILDWQIPKI